jgi:hypothetical protein
MKLNTKFKKMKGKKSKQHTCVGRVCLNRSYISGFGPLKQPTLKIRLLL